MSKPLKILIAGVGGQGVVFLTNLIVEAALAEGLDVATSEIHGLAQRGGSVSSGITIGENGNGFVERGGVDILIGLEPLEAQRSLAYLHADSVAIIDRQRLLPYSVNAAKEKYPETEKTLTFLREHIGQLVYVEEELTGLKSILRNLYLLGRLHELNELPIKAESIETAIRKMAREGLEEESLQAFRKGKDLAEIETNKT